MSAVLFFVLLFLHYFLSIRMWQKYRGKKLALFYLACLAGTGILYLLSYYVLSGYDRGALRLCHGFFGSLLIVLVIDFSHHKQLVNLSIHQPFNSLTRQLVKLFNPSVPTAPYPPRKGGRTPWKVVHVQGKAPRTSYLHWGLW